MLSTEKLLQNLPALCNMIRRIALSAGEIILDYYEGVNPAHSQEKGDGSPVTFADKEAEILIHMRLEELTPDIPVIGEEAVAKGKAPARGESEYFWLVDALDGTKEFIGGGQDFTVNIALVKDDTPVLGVVYAPALGMLYAGCGPDTAIRWNRDTQTEKSIHVRRPPEKGLSVVASIRHGNDKLGAFLESFKVEKLVRRGSSLKICIIAEGKADMYPRLGPTSEWDTAAADAVLRAAGGQITDLAGKPLSYGGFNRKFLNPEFVAASYDWCPEEMDCAQV